LHKDVVGNRENKPSKRNVLRKRKWERMKKSLDNTKAAKDGMARLSCEKNVEARLHTRVLKKRLRDIPSARRRY